MNPTAVMVLGAAGGFGELVTRLLSAEGYDLGGVDAVPPSPENAEHLKTFLCNDVSSPNQAVIEAVERADWIISCMPQDPTLAAFRNLTPHMRSGALFLDVLSVKTPISHLWESSRSDVECVGIHPMFAPSVGFRDQNVAIVRGTQGKHCSTIESLLMKWGARVHYLSAEQHDRIMAAVQVATHASIIAFGLALKAIGYNISEVLPVSSPPHRTLLALLARLANGNPAVYWQVQSENPLAPAARAGVIEGAGSLHRIVATRGLSEFSQLLDDVRDLLADKNDQLTELATEMFALPLRSDRQP